MYTTYPELSIDIDSYANIETSGDYPFMDRCSEVIEYVNDILAYIGLEMTDTGEVYGPEGIEVTPEFMEEYRVYLSRWN